MQELMQSTSRIRRGWLDRLRGYKRAFETEITDGEHNAYGRGPTAEASQKSAQRIWDAEFWEATPELTLRSQVHTPCRSRSREVAGAIFAYPPPCGNSSHSLAVSSRAIRAQSVTSTFISRSLFRFAIAIARLADLTGAFSLPSFSSSPFGRI